jgi:hypothetical protein
MAEFAAAFNRSGCGQLRVDEVLIVFLAMRVKGFTKRHERTRYQSASHMSCDECAVAQQ